MKEIKQERADQMITILNETFGFDIPKGTKIFSYKRGYWQKSQGAWSWLLFHNVDIGSCYTFNECLDFLKKHKKATILSDGELVFD